MRRAVLPPQTPLDAQLKHRSGSRLGRAPGQINGAGEASHLKIHARVGNLRMKGQRRDTK